MVEEADEPVFIYTTFATREAAAQVGGQLVEERVAACVNIYPGMVSIYSWEGTLEQAEEVGMLVKTRRARAEEAVAALERLHPYDTPAVLVIPTSGGSDNYRRWIKAMTEPAAEPPAAMEPGSESGPDGP
ncbi:MAG: divalent-cation tolerance protein CutA [Rhodobiaceae bacterium]|nr:divalent-cation tolerance protein CutA [Rhodobiaceae bacterium]